MLQQLLSLLPRELGTAALVLAMLGTMLGLGLWIAGARFQRSILTLTTVAGGAWVGMCLPRWCGWGIDGMATAVAGAVVLGITGYVCTRFWVGIGFGLMMALWSAMIVWLACHGNGEWTWPDVNSKTTLPGFLAETWRSLPNNVISILPWVSGAATLSGLMIALLWPKLGGVLLFSSVGVSLLLTTTLVLLENGRPQWLGALPAATWAQSIILIVMVLVGAFVQWRFFSPASAGGAGAKKAK